MLNVASIGSGGGVYVSSSVMTLSGIVFKENHGATGGGWSSPVLQTHYKLDRVGGLKNEQYLQVTLSNPASANSHFRNEVTEHIGKLFELLHSNLGSVCNAHRS